MMEKLSVGMRRMYIHTPAWHTFYFITFVSISVTMRGRRHSGRRWPSGRRCRRLCWRCAGSFAPSAWLWILRCAILAWKAAIRLIFINHCRVSCYRGPHLCQQNVNRSGSHMQSSLTLRATSPVLLITSRCSPTALKLSKVLSDSARAFSGANKSTCSYAGAFRMLWDLTFRIVQFWSSWDLNQELRESSGVAETAAQLCRSLREQARSLCRTAGGLVSFADSSGSYIATRHFIVSY